GAGEQDDRRKRARAGGRLGSAADRAGRRARRSERAVDRRVPSPVSAAVLLSEEEESRRSRVSRKHRGGHRAALAPTRKSHAEIYPPVTVRALSEAIGVKATDLLRNLMNLNQMVTINATLDEEIAAMLALQFGI